MAAPASSSAAANLMLAIHEKKTNSVEFYRPLCQFIAFNYSEREAQNLEDDLQDVKQMRSDLERPSDSPDIRRNLLQKYYKALCVMESRFPISPEKEHINTITFTWYDAFKNKNKASQQNIHLEKAAVLFNLGAVHSQIALSVDRSTPSSRMQASHSFMASAGAFAFLRDNASMKASIGQSTVDISAECAGMLERLMLAQAQECVFEKVVAEGKSPGLCAKISRQLKVAQFYAEACYRYGLELHEKEEIAEEIARLRSGITALVDAKKSTKGVAAQLIDAVNRLEANINRNLERALKENDRVYLMRVPGANTLPPLPAASLVKSTPMTDILDASKEKLFASLIPDSSAKALSRYTEMLDDIIRMQAEKLQQGSEIARVRLKEMDLPDSILALEGNITLPMDLKEDVEAVQISGGPSGLEAELQQLRDLRRVNQELLVQTEEQLQKEAREDAQFRSQFGTRWTRPQSSTLTKNLQDRLNRFVANLKQATESDSRIERAVRDHSALMSILDRQPIESALPTLAKPIMSLDANEDAIAGALKQSLRQLETLGAQRAGLEDMLKEMKRKDDILPKLMTSTGSYEDLFRKELAKYDHICEEISQNIEAQEQLLMQIQVQNEEFSAVFNLEDYKASRGKCYKQISAAIAKYREIKENINEGLKFYVTLQDAITNVKQQCSDFLMTRNIQCQEMIEDVQRQMAGFNFQDKGPSGYPSNYPSVGQMHQTQRTASPQQPDPQSTPHLSRPQIPYYHPAEQPPVAGYGHPHPLYSSSQQQLPPSPYNVPAASSPYPSQLQQQPVEYGQPAYPGWRGTYYNTHSQHPGYHPPPPYSVPPPYPPHQSGYYKHQ
ncbi:vacuolar-sorting protein BRO1-like isoform X2 [Telopea speciosissima]|uniref:vacuolar-sorting protein BRO1-like isoform X2 n=1 Tax=Telopea speciosissima TaxID=54955 RepID=UPI001CC5DDFC|nr:vacuolar-sorting protein BRO1-like isoform X2 [Telopea speciosissima]